mmetsp:Transcript_14895/g.33591  ORF Transcript_14895/g.33591 Transcript_14895/m.33591 type:complete len:220 (-) Transcript_14895:249-908(-)
MTTLFPSLQTGTCKKAIGGPSLLAVLVLLTICNASIGFVLQHQTPKIARGGRNHRRIASVGPRRSMQQQQQQQRRRRQQQQLLQHKYMAKDNTDEEREGTEDEEDDDEDDDYYEPVPVFVADVRGRPAGVVIEDLNWRVEKLRLEEANTRRFLKSGPRFLPYEECQKWVQAWGERWTSETEWNDWISAGEKRNSYIPSRPQEYYTRTGDWVSWVSGHWC